MMNVPGNPQKHTGLTLAEILVALAVISVIAVIAVPRVLNAGSPNDTTRQKQAVKQVATQFEAAYTQYRLNIQTVPTNMTAFSLTPYLNYVSYDTTSQVDGTPCFGSPINCYSASYYCYRMNNNAMLVLNGQYFNGNGVTNAIHVWIDPDGKVTGSSDDSGKAVNLYMYYSGRIKDRSQIDTGTQDNNSTDNPNAGCTPSWWSWN